MIFTNDLENIAEPNHCDAQQNLHSPTPMLQTILTLSKEPSEDDSTNKRFHCYLYLVIFLLSKFVILLMSGEVEVGSAEECQCGSHQPTEE